MKEIKITNETNETGATPLTVESINDLMKAFEIQEGPKPILAGWKLFEALLKSGTVKKVQLSPSFSSYEILEGITVELRSYLPDYVFIADGNVYQMLQDRVKKFPEEFKRNLTPLQRFMFGID